MKFVSLNPTTFKEFILSRVRGQSNMCDARANFSQQKTGVWTCTLRQPHSIDCKCAPYGQLPSSADVGKPPSKESQTRKKGVSNGLSVKSIMDYLANSGVILKCMSLSERAYMLVHVHGNMCVCTFVRAHV
jgi:hypothetical protein